MSSRGMRGVMSCPSNCGLVSGGVSSSARLARSSRAREGPIPPSTLALLRAIPARIDVEWLFPTPGSAHTRRPRIAWPPHEELRAKLQTMSYRAVSRELGVLDNGLRNRPRAYESGRRPGQAMRNDGGKLWRYDNWTRDVWNPTVARTGMDPTPKEFRASWETHLIAAGANTDDVAAIAGHSINVQAEHYVRPSTARRSSSRRRSASDRGRIVGRIRQSEPQLAGRSGRLIRLPKPKVAGSRPVVRFHGLALPRTNSPQMPPFLAIRARSTSRGRSCRR
jgi:hypothetical protein